MRWGQRGSPVFRPRTAEGGSPVTLTQSRVNEFSSDPRRRRYHVMRKGVELVLQR